METPLEQALFAEKLAEVLTEILDGENLSKLDVLDALGQCGLSLGMDLDREVTRAYVAACGGDA